jgi:hypothetical protein
MNRKRRRTEEKEECEEGRGSDVIFCVVSIFLFFRKTSLF